MGVMMPETCWDRSLTIKIRLVASCWFSLFTLVVIYFILCGPITARYCRYSVTSWWWMGIPPDTCRAVYRYKWTVYCCILLGNYWHIIFISIHLLATCWILLHLFNSTCVIGLTFSVDDCHLFRHKYTNESTEIMDTLEVHTKACRDIEFSKDGNILFSTSKDKSIMLSDVSTGKLKQFYENAHE